LFFDCGAVSLSNLVFIFFLQKNSINQGVNDVDDVPPSGLHQNIS